MKTITYLIVSFNFLIIPNIYSQDLVCDTTVIIRRKFIINSIRHLGIDNVKKKGCSFTQTFFKTKDSSSYYLSNNICHSYFIFLDKKLRKIEEGYWCAEFFNGFYISYHKNGKVKSKGVYDSIDKIGEWLYYNENGILIKTVKY